MSIGNISRVACALLFAACAHRGARPAAIAAPSSPQGRWEGEARFPGDLPILVGVTIDSTNDGWRGAFISPAVGADSIRFTSVTRLGDTVVLALPASAESFVVHARLSANGRRLEGTMDGPAQGTFRAGRAETTDGAALSAEARRIAESRRLAATMIDTVAAVPHANPDSARLVTSDIPLFWAAVDAARPDSLGDVLQRAYLARGSVGLRDFIPGRILSAEDLAAYVTAHRARYDSIRAANLDVTRADSAIRAAFRRLKNLYPDAVFPDVYFVVGRFNSGGTSTRHGLLIGAEMYRDAAALPAIVSHELIHYEQSCPAPTLLEHSLMEGSADFVGELISGTHIDNAAQQYGLAHEHQLWAEFTPHFNDTAYFPWLYGRRADGLPNDLGYFIGYRIARAYYERASDKTQAVRDIITACRGDVRAFLAMSGYNP